MEAENIQVAFLVASIILLVEACVNFAAAILSKALREKRIDGILHAVVGTVLVVIAFFGF